jgi:hypothetical protein
VRKTRLEASSDGVVAILITIMVLKLRAPAGADWASLRLMGPTFWAYILLEEHPYCLFACIQNWNTPALSPQRERSLVARPLGGDSLRPRGGRILVRRE